MKSLIGRSSSDLQDNLLVRRRIHAEHQARKRQTYRKRSIEFKNHFLPSYVVHHEALLLVELILVDDHCQLLWPWSRNGSIRTAEIAWSIDSYRSDRSSSSEPPLLWCWPLSVLEVERLQQHSQSHWFEHHLNSMYPSVSSRTSLASSLTG